jgi:hypothetical protein
VTDAPGVTERLYRITAPHFCAGFVVHGHHVRDTAPILKWLKGGPLTAVLVYCRRKKWQLERVSVLPNTPAESV